MNIKDFAKPTILKGTQYGTTITIELDHSDTSIDEVMDGFLTIVKGLGYLDSTVNQWIKDKSMDIYDDEYEIMSNSLADDWFDESNGEDYPGQFKDWSNETPTEEDCGCNDTNEYDDWNDEEVDWNGWDSVDEKRIDIIGQNGNEGTHYGLVTDEDIEECELNDKPHFDWNDGIEEEIEEEFNDYGERIKPIKKNIKKTSKSRTKNGTE
jgi:hypothetical protein